MHLQPIPYIVPLFVKHECKVGDNDHKNEY